MGRRVAGTYVLLIWAVDCVEISGLRQRWMCSPNIVVILIRDVHATKGATTSLFTACMEAVRIASRVGDSCSSSDFSCGPRTPDVVSPEPVCLPTLSVCIRSV